MKVADGRTQTAKLELADGTCKAKFKVRTHVPEPNLIT
jgi:hypothetical protein